MLATTRVSTWNGVLRSLSRPPYPEGFHPITSPLPLSIPAYNDFCINRMSEVDTRWLLLLGEFQHWNDPDFGPQVQVEDLKLLDSGRMSMIDLFRRGPKSLSWYERIREADKIQEENHHERIATTIESEDQRTEVKCEAGPGPSTLANRSRNLQEAMLFTADNTTHEELVLKDFIETHHQHMRAHMENDREKQAEPAFEVGNSPTDAAFTCPRPCPQPQIESLNCVPTDKEAKARYRTADEQTRSLVDVIIREKSYMDHEDPAFYAALEQWQKAADELEAMEFAHRDAQSLAKQSAHRGSRGLTSTCEPSHNTCTAPLPSPHRPVTRESSDTISSDSVEGGPENCPDCLEQLRNDIVDIENLAREMRAEYKVARAKIEGTDDFVVVSRDVCAEVTGGRKGEEPIREI